jgi:Domain of unknown function (DUF4262)
MGHPKCAACNDPGTDDASWLERTLRGMHMKIERFGWTAMYVLEEETVPGWGYTIGLSGRFEHPEFVVVGLGDAGTMALLETLANRVTNGERFDGGAELVLELRGGGRFRLAPVHPSHWDTDRFNMWWNYYGVLGEPRPQRSALQIQWPDAQGRFPGDRELDRRVRRRQTRLDRLALAQSRRWPHAA